MSLPKHLGGHLNKTHIDNGSLDWAIRLFKVKSFLDIGYRDWETDRKSTRLNSSH